MKKLFAIALIAVSFAACNSSETKTEETPAVDTTATVTPTPAPAPDSATVAPAHHDSAAKAPAADTTKK